MAIPCTKCKGSGLQPREGCYADKGLHPVLSVTDEICGHCNGSTYEPVLSAREIAIRAAKQDSGS